MSDETVSIEINGKPYQARKGAMLIEVADQAGIKIPRFCYHHKLSVAANCRMCLVEVEKAPKPLPACATPVMDGMKVFTHSPLAVEAQEATMEFLLINHPLDCPICDQGGECELQDVAMGYGGDVSRYTEQKRVVTDKNIGPLIATDMTRCIHCTRCVRFGQEIAGIMELGAPGRGENMRITTYVASTVDSEISGNVIDLCPVGALTAKPSRYTARAWELMQTPGVAAHDCLGANTFVHSFRNKVNRVVPRDNEQLNECWLSDRDRFSYEGYNSNDRLTAPQIKQDGQWHTVEWEVALKTVVEGLRSVIDANGAEQLGVLCSANATLEEMHLLQGIARELGCHNIDYRLRQSDFSQQDNDPVYPGLGCSVDQLERSDAVLLIGSYPRKEQPLINHRLRKASMAGKAIMAVNMRVYDYNFALNGECVAPPQDFIQALAGLTKALAEKQSAQIPAAVSGLLSDVQITDEQRDIADRLQQSATVRVLLGPQAMAHPQYGQCQALAGVIAQICQGTLGYLTNGANACGAALAGVLPHRGVAGNSHSQTGLNAWQMIQQPRKAYMLHAIEPDKDTFDPCATRAALLQAELVVCSSAYDSHALRQLADVILPVAVTTESAGTFVNAQGDWQTFTGACAPPGEARPAWKIYRVLGNMLDLPGFDYTDPTQIGDEVQQAAAQLKMADSFAAQQVHTTSEAPIELMRLGAVNIYADDAVVRRARSLQMTRDAQDVQVRLNPEDARRLGVLEATRVLVTQGECETSMDLIVDDQVPVGCAWIPAGTDDSAALGPMIGPVSIEAD